MSKMHFLLLKTHKNTGLKYLCYHGGTLESCYKYNGSGKYWKLHLQKHGIFVDTTIVEYSDNKDYISERGIEYSKLWDIVNSSEFANLIIEDAQKSAASLDYTKIGIGRKERIKSSGYTIKELEAHKKISEYQTGKSMKDRLNNPNWVDPRKGKKFSDIYGDNYTHPKKGKSLKDIPKDSEPFKFIINNDIIEYYKSEKDFELKTGMSRVMISKIKKKDTHIIKRQSNAKHSYNNGDVVKCVPISIEEYKQLTSLMLVR